MFRRRWQRISLAWCHVTVKYLHELLEMLQNWYLSLVFCALLYLCAKCHPANDFNCSKHNVNCNNRILQNAATNLRLWPWILLAHTIFFSLFRYTPMLIKKVYSWWWNKKKRARLLLARNGTFIHTFTIRITARSYVRNVFLSRMNDRFGSYFCQSCRKSWHFRCLIIRFEGFFFATQFWLFTHHPRIHSATEWRKKTTVGTGNIEINLCGGYHSNCTHAQSIIIIHRFCCPPDGRKSTRKISGNEQTYTKMWAHKLKKHPNK